MVWKDGEVFWLSVWSYDEECLVIVRIITYGKELFYLWPGANRRSLSVPCDVVSVFVQDGGTEEEEDDNGQRLWGFAVL